MKRALVIQDELKKVDTIQDMASVFEAVASIHIAQIKDQVVASTKFFHELWNLYSQLRVDEKELGRERKDLIKDREAVIAATSDGSLIGDIDERIMTAMLNHPNLDKADIYVIGAHGVTLLSRRGIRPKQAFRLPEKDQNIQVGPIAEVLSKYQRATMYYQTYVSLLHQDIARIELFSAVAALGQKAAAGDVISSRDYIFEPSLPEVINYMESVMLEIALGQIMLESKLAQYASRFNAMHAAKSRANDMQSDLKLNLHRALRSQGDERTREIMSSIKVTNGVSRG
ncbi:hypothetical protein EPO04_03615 [Patescibacteria group bacterium]|nr:MAG: hypothetical protein EPO04_03615 [Patescibacteria group bacterium]